VPYLAGSGTCGQSPGRVGLGLPGIREPGPWRAIALAGQDRLPA